MKWLALFFAWILALAPSGGEAPRAERTYERCVDRLSKRVVLVERVGETFTSYDGEGVVMEGDVALEHCVTLSRHQFRSERRYRRLLAP